MATEQKVISVDTEMCNRFMKIYKESGLDLTDFARACGLSSVSYVNEIGRYVIEPSKKVIISLYENLGISPNWLLLGIGPKHIKK